MGEKYTKALKWFRKAVDQGNADAQKNLGYMYQHGEGVPQDYVQAHVAQPCGLELFGVRERKP